MRVISSGRVPFTDTRPAADRQRWLPDLAFEPTARLREALYRNLLSPRERYARTVRRSLRAGPLLDLGCGRTAPFLASCEADVLKLGVDRLVSSRSGQDLLRADVTRLPVAAASVEVACCRSVLEHLPEPTAFFSEVRRVLRPGGTFVALTPNRLDYVSVAASLLPNRWHPRAVAALTGRSEQETFPTFYRANTAGAIRRCARRAGLSVVSIKYLRAHPHYLQSTFLTYAVGVAIEQLVERHIHAVRPWLLMVLVKEPAVMTPRTSARGRDEETPRRA